MGEPLEKLKRRAGEKQDIQPEQPETVESDEENAETNKVKVVNGKRLHLVTLKRLLN